MLSAYYRVKFPSGESYVHGGNKSEIRECIKILLKKRFPKGIKAFIYWGTQRRPLRCVVQYGKKAFLEWIER